MLRSKYEFMGPHGPAFLIAGIPTIVLLLLKILENYKDPTFLDTSLNFKEVLLSLVNDKLFTWSSFFVVICWLLFQLVLYKFLPGEEVLGIPLANGKSLVYPINGLSSFISTTSLVATIYSLKGPGPFLWVTSNLKQLCFASTIVCAIISGMSYAYSHRRGADIVGKNDTRFLIYDFWMGRELNPRVFGIDIKYFFELRPGLMGWILVVFCFQIKQYAEEGTVGTALLLVLLMQSLYVIDALKNESSILSTTDITREGFGYMLCLGSMVVEPFFYSLQANYLVNRNLSLSYLTVCSLIFMNLTGAYVFRSSNNQKNYFRRSYISGSRDIDPRNYLIAKDGKPLLHSGWWGLARHINYFGE